VKYMCGYLRDGAADGKVGVISGGQRSPVRAPEGSSNLERRSRSEEKFESESEGGVISLCAFRDAILDIMLQQLLEDHAAWERVMETYFENRRQFFGVFPGREPLMKRPCARKHVSLAAKWCPRESSKYGWVFELLVDRYRKLLWTASSNSIYVGFPGNMLRGRENVLLQLPNCRGSCGKWWLGFPGK
jgi:hypothetical protein